MVERLPPLYALRAFEVAARTCSFTRAGEELALTQSAISRHIRTLEASSVAACSSATARACASPMPGGVWPSNWGRALP